MNLILIAATYRRHKVFSRRRMRQMSLSPNSGNTNDLQTTLGEGQPCGYRGHLVCTGNSTLPAADPAVMETGTVAPLHKLPKKKIIFNKWTPKQGFSVFVHQAEARRGPSH